MTFQIEFFGAAGQMEWYGAFRNTPPVFLVHGESRAQNALTAKLKARFSAPVSIAVHGQSIEI
jgi:metallo-beta-lactamase family protein